MTADRRLRRVRLALCLGVALAALAWAAGVAGGLFLLLGVADLVVGLARPVRVVLGAGSVLLGGAVAASIVWRNRGATSLPAVALWLEERAPSLRYALVTLVDGSHPAVAPKLERLVSSVEWTRTLRRRLARATLIPLLGAVTVLAGLMALPRGVLSRITQPEPGDVLSQPTRSAETQDPLRPIVVGLLPPAYTGLPPQTLEDPALISGLEGTAVRIVGRGTPEGLAVTLGGRVLRGDTAGARWSLAFTLPDSALALRLTAGRNSRLVVIDGRPDSLPVVQLSTPLRDTVWPAPHGPLDLRAVVHDDYGLAEGWFEYVVTSGAGERFTFRSGVVARRALAGTREATLDGVLSLDSLHLEPGDVMHLRAVALDRNVVTGPDTGFSDTRMIRVPRPGEADSASVYAMAPADADSSLLSERMLITLAEALQQRRPRLQREVVLRESQSIARDQAALRRQVAGVIFHRLGGDASAEESDTLGGDRSTPEGVLSAADRATEQSGDALDFAEDETPVVAINRPLLEAYNAMWVAGRELEQGEPGHALPAMREALAAIMRARAAERMYLRGRPPAAVVDLARVRLAGKLADVRPSPAHGEALASGSVAALLERFTLAVEALPGPAALDSLTILRLDALRTEPEFAAALARAVGALQSGRDATGDLVAARRALGDHPEAVPTLLPWGSP